MRMSLILIVAAALAASALTPFARDADAIVICQRKKRVTLRPTTCKKKEQQVTLGPDAVPAVTNATNATNAQNADKLGGQDPSAFEPALTHVPLTEIDPNSEKLVGQVGPFHIIFACSGGGSATIRIKNAGEDHSIAHSSDDDDDDFMIGEYIDFDFDDAGDAGFAVSPSGWAVQVGGLGGTADATVRTVANGKCLAWTTYFIIAKP